MLVVELALLGGHVWREVAVHDCGDGDRICPR
jgi:hypothetical protein